MNRNRPIGRRSFLSSVIAVAAVLPLLTPLRLAAQVPNDPFPPPPATAQSTGDNACFFQWVVQNFGDGTIRGAYNVVITANGAVGKSAVTLDGMPWHGENHFTLPVDTLILPPNMHDKDTPTVARAEFDPGVGGVILNEDIVPLSIPTTIDLVFWDEIPTPYTDGLGGEYPVIRVYAMNDTPAGVPGGTVDIKFLLFNFSTQMWTIQGTYPVSPTETALYAKGFKNLPNDFIHPQQDSIHYRVMYGPDIKIDRWMCCYRWQ